jgi:hypothetical protein
MERLVTLLVMARIEYQYFCLAQKFNVPGTINLSPRSEKPATIITQSLSICGMLSIASTFTIDTCGANMLFKRDGTSPAALTSSDDHTKSQLILAGEGGLIIPMPGHGSLDQASKSIVRPI